MIKARAVLLSCEELSPQLLLLLRSPLCGGPAASPFVSVWSPVVPRVRRRPQRVQKGPRQRVRAEDDQIPPLPRVPAGASLTEGPWRRSGRAAAPHHTATRATEAQQDGAVSRARCVRLPRQHRPGPIRSGRSHGDEPPSSLSEPSETHQKHSTFTYIHRVTTFTLTYQTEQRLCIPRVPPPPHTHTHRLDGEGGGGGMLNNIS